MTPALCTATEVYLIWGIYALLLGTLFVLWAVWRHL